jgi:LruC domain-containing protein
MYKGKRFHLFLVSLVTVSVMASSCSKVKDLYTETDTSPSTLFPDGGNVPSGFTWNSAKSMDIRVAIDDKFDGQYFYRVEIFDNDPLLGTGANLLAAGQAKKGQDFVGQLMLPTMAKYLYLRETSPLGIASVTMIAVDAAKSSINVTPGSTTSSLNSNKASVARSAVRTTISNTNSSSVSTFAGPAVVVPNDAIEISGNGTISVADNKSYVIKSGVTFTGKIDANNGTSNVKIYVQGKWKNSSFEFNLGSNNGLYITDGGSLELINVTQNTNGGFVNYGSANLSKMETKNNTSYVNYGTLDADKADITNGSFTNYGVATIQNLSSTTNGTVIRNEGTLTVKNATLTNATLEAVCHTTIQSLTTNGATISISSGALLSLDKLDAGGTKFNLASSSILAVTTLAKFNSQASTMRGPASGQALARLKKVDVNNQYMAITYSGNLEIACSDHTPNGEWNTFYVLNSPAKLVPYNKSTVVIAGTSCNAGGNNAPGGNPNDQTVTEVNLGTYSYAFEDNWPSFGDYDMNDFVMDVTITKTQNSANKVTKVKLTSKLRSVGATRRLAAAIQLDGVLANNVKSVTYSKEDLIGTNLPLASNKVESGQKYAVLPICDDAHKAFGISDTKFISTQNGGFQPIDVVITVEFNTPIDAFTQLNLNSFIITNGYKTNSRNEVHMVNYKATDKMNTTLVSYQTDKVHQLAVGDPFKSTDGYPWALCVPGSFKYPSEGKNIVGVYSTFKPWALSGGTQNTDWYLNK